MSTSTTMTDTSLDEIPAIFRDLRGTFNTGKTRSVAWRKRQIEQLYKMCDEQKEAFAAAANADFHRPNSETILYDCGVVSSSLTFLFM